MNLGKSKLTVFLAILIVVLVLGGYGLWHLTKNNSAPISTTTMPCTDDASLVQLFNESLQDGDGSKLSDQQKVAESITSKADYTDDASCTYILAYYAVTQPGSANAGELLATTKSLIEAGQTLHPDVSGNLNYLEATHANATINAEFSKNYHNQYPTYRLGE